MVTMLVVLLGTAHAQAEHLRAVLSMNEKTYVLGEPLFLTLVLKNTGDEPLQAHLADAVHAFALEIAKGLEVFKPLQYRTVERLGQRPPLRTLEPGEYVGTSEALLLEAPQITTMTREAMEAASRERPLVCDKPGKYRLRAKVYVDFGGRQPVISSNEAQFQVTPAASGFKQFVDFAKRHVGEDLTIGPKGYEASRALGDELEATPYHRYVVWMRMKHYLKESMGDDQPSEDISRHERAERAAYRLLAEQLVGCPTTLRTHLGEVAVVYLTLYYVQAGDLPQALKYAEVTAQELPWSPRKGMAKSIRRTLAKRGNGEPG